MKKLKPQIVLGMICVILGLMISVQFKNVTSPKNVYATKSVDELTSEIEDLKKQRDDLSKKAEGYQNQIDAIEKSVSGESSTAAQMKAELDNLRVLSGMTDVEGPGIIMTLTPVNDISNQSSSQVYSTDLLDIVNEMNSVSAEAISINDQRYVERTQIVEAGASIKINDEKYSPTSIFTIKAIGDPNVLEGAFNMPGGIKEKLQDLGGINVKITQDKDIKILKYNKDLTYKYIKGGR
jgi:uncharacterized protein YlxW (UPF0749 family)